MNRELCRIVRADRHRSRAAASRQQGQPEGRDQGEDHHPGVAADGRLRRPNLSIHRKPRQVEATLTAVMIDVISAPATVVATRDECGPAKIGPSRCGSSIRRS